ncbi:hypothetical protein ACTFIW_010985 [Dictyostelium discoideum]
MDYDQIKIIFNLILNNIFKLQLYSLIFEFNDIELIRGFTTTTTEQQQQQQQQEPKNINLKEIKIKTKHDKYIQELNNINNTCFTIIIKNKS